MVHQELPLDLGAEPIVEHCFDTSSGQSGSPIWTSIGGQCVALAIHCSHAGNGSSTPNRARRITEDVAEAFDCWIDEARRGG